MATKKRNTEDPASVSVRVSKEIKRRLKVFAARIDKDMREVADLALDKYLKEHDA